ncbi:MAG: hypothetical protein IOMNBAOH_01794 [Rhodocyclaceae bacterium]|nr:hypothetical protein [Rhodocyclaceae bacterium]
MNRYSMAYLEVIRSLVQDHPDVRKGWMFGLPAFFVGGKIFACLYENGIGIKLPDAEAARALACPGVRPFQPYGKKPMREWIQIDRDRPNVHLDEIGLLDKSIAYVSTLALEARRAARPVSAHPSANRTEAT